ncbi:dUTP diphosphatase [Aquibacillus koreensis]|uniref:dUTP diphosphatase n=1 Tax=Aquibacillus koreensis TaxID=279446 RepID=A0A9X3WIN6_9BACI|nr:dUTP diphosphatase [Aquibacillus koreensis]MCT2535059.1 dUTP diphosphatase [Aquibacillus koreensis]MDC3419220.1 dUTP diphosphatase [Aquibacillus koreensis]
MNWEPLFSMQKKLDAYIQSNHHLQTSELFDKKILALLVEVGELANETRCFKFWSKKPPSDQQVILEEYVDGIHFILSLGIDKGYSNYNGENKTELVQKDITLTFHHVYEKIIAFKNEPSKACYTQLFDTYIRLGELLGFSEQSMSEAYLEKNKVNFERQDQGY